MRQLKTRESEDDRATSRLRPPAPRHGKFQHFCRAQLPEWADWSPLSRIAYQRAPLAILEIRPGVFGNFSGAGGNVTALSASQGLLRSSTAGYGPRVEEIRRSITSMLQQAPRCG